MLYSSLLRWFYIYTLSVNNYKLQVMSNKLKNEELNDLLILSDKVMEFIILFKILNLVGAKMYFIYILL